MGGPYKPEFVPSEHSTPLARFKALPPPVPESSSPEEIYLREARCEISSRPIASPVILAKGGNILVAQGCGGWKDGDPITEVLPLGLPRDKWLKYYEHTEDPGHISPFAHVAVDGERNLVWTADHARIKSSKIRFTEKDSRSTTLHTFKSNHFTGPLALLDGGARIMRSGEKGLAFWNVDTAETLQTTRKRYLGGKLPDSYIDNSWRDFDDIPDFEMSRGLKQDSQIAFRPRVKRAGIGAWCKHPSSSNTMICAGSKEYRVFGLDITTGRMNSTFVGHGAFVSSLSTSPGDPNAFLTTCHDGAARLYDVRAPVPSLTIFDAKEQLESSILVHLGGAPCKYPSVVE